MSRDWSAGSTTAWRKLRARILADNQRTNGGRCQLQTDVCTGHATQVHHTKGRAITGDNPDHLLATCKACNLKVGQPRPVSPPPRPATRW